MRRARRKTRLSVSFSLSLSCAQIARPESFSALSKDRPRASLEMSAAAHTYLIQLLWLWERASGMQIESSMAQRAREIRKLSTLVERPPVC